jgi:hypothetical protein
MSVATINLTKRQCLATLFLFWRVLNLGARATWVNVQSTQQRIAYRQ